MSDQGVPPDQQPGAGAPDDTPVEPSRPPSDATQVIPVVPSLPPTAGGPAPGAPPPPPPGAPSAAPFTYVDPTPPPPRKPAAWIFAGGFLLVALVVGLLVFALTRGDDGAVTSENDSVRLVLTRVDQAGTPASIDLTATVSAGDTGVTPFTWLVPAQPTTTSSATRRTDSTGRTEFRWAPVEGAIESTWSSTVVVREPWPDPTLVAPGAACTLTRDDVPQSLSASVSVEPPDPNVVVTEPGVTVAQVVALRFPNVRLVVGDALECELRGDVPPPLVPGDTTTSSSTLPESTTTSPESTTTIESTTTTSTTVPDTTTTSSTSTTTTTTTTTSTTTTSTTTTTTTTTVPAPPTAIEVLEARDDTGDFLALIEVAELTDFFGAPPGGRAPATLFAPTDDALAKLFAQNTNLDPNDIDDAFYVVNNHVVVDELLDAASIGALTRLETEGNVVNVDSYPPLVIEGATVIAEDLAAIDTIVHVLDAALPLGGRAA